MAANVVNISVKRGTATVLRFHGALGLPDVTIDYSERNFNRKTNAVLENEIEDNWKQRTLSNTLLFNGTKFRLAGFKMIDNKLKIQLGMTSYKELCGTNLARNVNVLMENGDKELADKHAYLSQTLGVGILLVTSDTHLVVLRRASWTGEASGLWDRPGGHPEPSSVRLLAQLHGDTQQPVPDVQEHSSLNDDILHEVWNASINEAVDEVGLPRSCLPGSCVRLMGVSCNSDAGGKPSLEFLARLSLSASEVARLYTRGQHAEAGESSNIMLLPPHSLLSLVTILRRLYMTASDSEVTVSSNGKSHASGVTAVSGGGESRDPVSVSMEDLATASAPALIGALLLADALSLVS